MAGRSKPQARGSLTEASIERVVQRIAAQFRATAPAPSGPQKTQAATNAAHKRSSAYSVELWAMWPTPEQWPGVLDLYEAAAYRRVEYKTIWRACQTGRDGKARLAHQRFGSSYRISKAALDRFGLVEARQMLPACPPGAGNGGAAFQPHQA